MFKNRNKVKTKNKVIKGKNEIKDFFFNRQMIGNNLITEILNLLFPIDKFCTLLDPRA